MSVMCCCLAAAVLLPLLFIPHVHASGTDNRKVRVGYYLLNNYQEYDSSTGEYRGYSYDYMLTLAQYAGWDYEFVPLDSYEEGLQLLKSGDIDLLNNVVKSDDLERSLDFSALSSGESYICLLVRPENNKTAYEDYAAFGDLTIGLDYTSSLNNGFVEYCKDNDCMPKLIYYHSAQEVQQALESGEIGGYIASSLKDVNMRVVAKFDTVSSYFATTKGNSDLLNELDRAMNTLKTSDPYFEEKLFAKYHSESPSQETVLTGDEQDFIASGPVVRVTYDSSWEPVSYSDGNSSFKGAMAELFSAISRNTGLRFEYVPAKSYSDALDAISSGQADVIAGFPYDFTWARAKNVRLTSPFISMTVFSAFSSDPDDDVTVATPYNSYQQYYYSDILRSGNTFINYNNAEDCLNAVLSGNAGSVFLDSYQLEFYQERAAYRNLTFKAAPRADYELALATSASADPYVSSILNKALSALGSENISSIFRDTALNASSKSLLDIIYANPRTAGLIFTFIGFLCAALISVIIYTNTSRKKNRQLGEAINARSEFLSNISHDMRTPLNGVIGYTDLALGSDDPAVVRSYLQKARASGELMLSLINDTLDVSKIESGKYVLTPENISADELIESVTIPIHSVAGEKGIDFIVDTSRMFHGTVFMDKVNTQKICMNLLSNAIKFTPAGGTVWFIVENFAPRSDGCNCRITVRDTGIGIGRDFLPKLFEPFMQEQAPEAQNTVGTGLGLSIVRSMVALMNGSVTVESVKGEGTRFDVYLPVPEVSESLPPEEESRFDISCLHGRKVLLCEDNAMNTEIITMLLRNAGIEPDTAANGEIGSRMFAGSQPGEYSAILMDLRMPVMNGFEATKEIRSMSRTDAGSVPIIALSADTYPEDIRKCLSAGMNGHVAKPIDRERLLEELARLCTDSEEA